MHKVLKLTVFFFFYSLPLWLAAQNKYAVLLAVNDYYEAPATKSPHSLKGCVNDAESIKGLLLNRFGFTASNIYSLYNAAATKKNFVDLMRGLLLRCKPGDAVVFYYSGHGVWMTNAKLEDDPVKRGMSQAIVMSDLYSPGWDCLVRDETLKDIFNRFVDKKITVTTIFDCCYSANLMMKPMAKYWTPLLEKALPVKKDLDISNIPYVPRVEKPAGCRNSDSTGNCLDTVDTDHDSFPDWMDWEVTSPLHSVVDSQGVAIEVDPIEFIAQPDNYYDRAKFTSDSTTDERSFNLRDALRVSNQSSIRPSERDQSGFFSLSAARDNEKGLEVIDISGLKHGAFTAALLQVYRENSATLPVYELMNKINAAMVQQGYQQKPGFHYDPGRMKGNLIGTNASGFNERIKAICIASKNGKLTINKGLADGVTRGNIFSAINGGGKQTIQIDKVFSDSAIGIDRSGKIKTGQALQLTDNHTISDPMIKLYLSATPFTPASFQNFMKTKILPLAKRDNYGDYHYANDELNNEVMIWKDANSFQKTANTYYQDQRERLLYVLLPIPSFISDRLKTLFGKDQNIELVNDPAKANYGIYLNYAKQRGDTAGEFVLYLHPVITGRVNMAFEIFSDDIISAFMLDLKNAAGISQRVYDRTKWLIRQKTNTWMNTYPRR